VSVSVGRSESLDLFDRFLVGDDAAAVKLFQKYNSRLFLYCAKVLGGQEQAEDVTQEIWERLIRLRSKPAEEQVQVRELDGFLFRIARNLCLNHIRGTRQSVSLSSVEEAALPSCTIPGASDLEELVVSSLDSLRFEYREILILNIYCGYRLDEIAAMMDVSPNAIWTRASRARAQLRKIVRQMASSSGRTISFGDASNDAMPGEDND
jgi:RNA polymerase sigma-70 factor (ECF subfamily)